MLVKNELLKYSFENPRKPMSDGLLYVKLSSGWVGLWSIKRISQKVWRCFFIDSVNDESRLYMEFISVDGNFGSIKDVAQTLAKDVAVSRGETTVEYKLRFWRDTIEYRKMVMEYLAFGTLGETEFIIEKKGE
jgi:hypothetical protein